MDWRRGLRRAVQLYVGLTLYGLSAGLQVRSGLGLDPWDVFHQGLARHVGLAIGTVVIVIGAAVLLLWIPLRQRPGLGTLSNVVLVGLSLNWSLALLPVPAPLGWRVAELLGGIVLCAIATGMYIGAHLGPGPRDGLMTGLARITGRSVRLVRTGLEVTVLVTGWLLGGTVGVGTVAFALTIGPLVQVSLRAFDIRPTVLSELSAGGATLTGDGTEGAAGVAGGCDASSLVVPRPGRPDGGRVSRRLGAGGRARRAVLVERIAAPVAGRRQEGDEPGDSDPGEGGEDGEDDPLEVADQAAEYAAERSAPASSVSAAALLAARSQAAGLPVSSARLQEVTDRPLDAEPAGYTDPVESNAGAGFRHVSGRATAVAVDGTTYYAGTADGGVWRSTDSGAHWTSIWDGQPTLSIGSLLVVGHTLWVGTGEANTNSDSYQGIGVYRSTDRGAHFTRVGGNSLIDRQIFRLRDDGVGHVYAATNLGLYRHSDAATSGAWTLLLKPDPNPDNSPYRTSFITDVVVRPGTNGRTVLAALGWRGGTDYNGFYLSTTGGGRGTFAKITPTGDIDAGDIGRTTFAYAADGSRLYAIVQSPEELNGGEDTNLQGVYASASGDPHGPYALIADSAKLGDSGSALRDLDGYHVGVQSWYNQALVVDPADPDHVYVSLEEVFETRNGGATFTTASPYWNFGLACGEHCPATTHPDQHASAITADGKILIGNDGGFYSRAMSVVGRGHWTDLNDTLRTLQYYDAAAGRAGSGLGYWGGLQDNGTSLLLPGFRVDKEPAGGDGGFVLVDPNDATRAVGEYTNLAMYSTVDGGHTFRSISPECGYYTNQRLCDPNARFIAPFQADVSNPNHWVALGSKVWDSTRGFNTVCERNRCNWTAVHDFGLDAAGGLNLGTALAVNGDTTYAAWVDSSGNPSPAFRSGIDTNFGGTWHRLALHGLPNRFIAGLTVDPADPAHVYAIYNGYSRRWIPGGGTGVVFESTDGGASWRNITGDLPDAPGDGLALVGGKLVLGTDVGLFVADVGAPTRWSRVADLPNVVVDNVRPVPGSSTGVVVATHGRGIWRLDV